MGFGRSSEGGGAVYKCLNCGDEFGKPAKFCVNCRTADQRRAMKEENDKIQDELKEKEAKGELPWQKT